MATPSGKRRALLSALLALPMTMGRASTASSSISIDSRQKFQIIEGFGTCINTWQPDVAAMYQRNDFHRLYLETLGASALRIELWGGLAPIARERWQDISWHDLNFTGFGARGQITTRIARQLHAASQTSLRIIATAWSPPPWMKINGSLGNGHPARKNFALNFENPVERGSWLRPASGDDGKERYQYIALNKLRRDRYLHFAKLLVEWVRYFRSLGIMLYAISPANEPRFSHWFSSCVYTPDEYVELVETIGWMFNNQDEPPVRLFGPEHMTWDVAGNRIYLEALGRRPTALKAMTAIASHGYVDGYAADRRPASTAEFGKLVARYGKKAWITEGGFGPHEWPAPLHQLCASFLYALRDGGISLLTTWQTLTRFPPDEHGLMSIRGPTKKFYAAMQFWRFIRPGMVRIGVDAGGPLDAVAFEEPATGKTVLILLNRTRSAAPVSLRLNGSSLATIDAAFVTDATRDCARLSEWRDPRSLVLPPESVATLIIQTRDT